VLIRKGGSRNACKKVTVRRYTGRVTPAPLPPEYDKRERPGTVSKVTCRSNERGPIGVAFMYDSNMHGERIKIGVALYIFMN
jgi:hypothetical protein